MPYEPPQYDPTAQLRTLFALIEMQNRDKMQQQSLAAQAQDSLLKFAGAGIDPGAVSQIGTSLGASPQAMQAATTLADQARLQRSREAALDPRMLAQQAGQVAPSVGPAGDLVVSPEQQSSFASSVAQIQADDPRMRAERLNALGSYVQSQSAAAQQQLGAQKFQTQEQRKTQRIAQGMQVAENKRSEAAQAGEFDRRTGITERITRDTESETSLANAMAFGREEGVNTAYNLIVQQRGWDQANAITARARELAHGIRAKFDSQMRASSVGAGAMDPVYLKRRYEDIGLKSEDWQVGLEANGKGFISALSTPEQTLADGTVIPQKIRWVDGNRSALGPRDQVLFGLNQQVATLKKNMTDAISANAAGKPFQEFMSWPLEQIGKQNPRVASFLTTRGLIVNGIIKLAQEGKISDQDYTRFLALLPMLSELKPGKDGESSWAKIGSVTDFLSTLTPPAIGTSGEGKFEVSEARYKDLEKARLKVLGGDVGATEQVILEGKNRDLFGATEGPKVDPRIDAAANSAWGGF